jgi:hypothetical protein
VIVFFSQRAIYLNGYHFSGGGLTVDGRPADSGRLLGELAVYDLATAGLFVLYVWVVILASRGHILAGRQVRCALGIPALFFVGFLFTRPFLSKDVYSYLGHGTLAADGISPYQHPTSELLGSAHAPTLLAGGWVPIDLKSPYGPLWTYLEKTVAQLTSNVTVAVLLLKVVVVGAALGSAALIWLILGRVRPADQLAGTLIFLWNPMIIVEFAGEGHNDALMIFCALGALALLCARRVTGSIVATSLGALTKYLPAMLLPAQAVYLWRNNGNHRRLFLPAALGAMIGAAVGLLVFSAVGGGGSMLDGVRKQGTAGLTASTPGVLYRLFEHSVLRAHAYQLSTAVASGVVIIGALVLSARVHTMPDMFRGCAQIALLFALMGTAIYWPWYATLPVALMALTPRAGLAWMAVLLSLFSRLMAPNSDIVVNGFHGLPDKLTNPFLVGILAPLVAWTALWLVQRRRLPADRPLAQLDVAGKGADRQAFAESRERLGGGLSAAMRPHEEPDPV